jgi:regulator of protease activity HflC (stomatin/prohibitin superfamily)
MLCLIVVAFDKSDLLLILIIISTNVFAVYFARKFAVTDFCVLYINKLMDTQWKTIINSLKNGEIIMSDESLPGLLFYNPFAEKIVENICRVTNQTTAIQELLANSTVKILIMQLTVRQYTKAKVFRVCGSL